MVNWGRGAALGTLALALVLLAGNDRAAPLVYFFLAIVIVGILLVNVGAVDSFLKKAR